MTYQQIKSFINTYIVQNGVNAITGAQLNTILNELADYKGFDSVVVTTLPAGSDATATVQGMTLVLGIPKGADGRDGQNAVNPFKGIYGSDNKPTGIFANGDYIYAPTSARGQTGNTIWKWNGTTWQDSGETPDLANGETFASSETLQQVAIDDSHLVNPVNTADAMQPVLAQANDVMQLKAKLEGVTAREEKVSVIRTGDGQNVYEGFIQGNIGTFHQSDYNYFIIVPTNEAKRVRWLAKENSSNSSLLGWAFGTFSGDVDSTLANFNPISTGIYGYNALDNQAVEYIKEVPEGATHAVLTIWIYQSNGGSAVTFDNFYCYLQYGDSISSLISVVKAVNTDTLEKYTNAMKYYDTTPQWSVAGSSRYVIPVVRGEKYIIENISDYNSIRFALLPESESKSQHTLNTNIANLLSPLYVVLPHSKMEYTIPDGIQEGIYLNVNAYSGSRIYKISDVKNQVFENTSDIDNLQNSIGDKITVTSDVIEFVDKEDFTNNPGIIKTVVSGQPKQWAPSSTGHQIIELPEGVNKIRISTPKGYNCYYSLFKTYEYTQGDSYPTTTYPTGWGTKTTVYISANKVIEISVGDARYLYLNKLKPSVYFIQSTGEPAKTVTIYGGFSDYSKERIGEVDNILQANSVTNMPRVFSDGVEHPNSPQMNILLQRASMMQNFKWTPKVGGKIRKSYKPAQDVAFFDAMEQTGIPYSGNTGLSVGFGVSLYTFLTAVDNKFSLMYTENLQKPISEWNALDTDTYGTVRHQPVNDHTNCWYGTYCNGFSARCTGIDVPIGCGAYDRVSKFFHIVSPVYNAYRDIRIGDVFSSASSVHTRLVTGISVQNGEVTSLTITEATGGAYKVITTTYSGDGLISYIDNLKDYGYRHFRVNDLYKNVEIGAEFEFDPDSYNELTEVCTFAGDKVTYLKGDMVVINFNLSESQTFNSTKPYLILEKYNSDTEGWDLIISKAIIDIDNTSYPTWSKYNSWAIEQEYLDSGLYRCYANEGQYQSNNFAEATYFDIVDSVNEVKKENEDKYIVTYKGNGELVGAYNGVIGTKNYTYYPLSNVEKQSQTFVFNPISFWLEWSSTYDGESNFEVRLYIKGHYGIVRSNMIRLE